MQYSNIQFAYFIDRPNRFIAHCRLIETGEIVVAHVKNTGRGKEVFLVDALVALNYQPAATRKTDYDLVAVKKEEMWINIDSQIPNALAAEAILNRQIKLPGLKGNITLLKREYRYQQSKFDIYFETDQAEKGFVEVKGMTLENQGIGAFPDAPTIRGLKHVNELIHAKVAGYSSYLLFIVQFPKVTVATIHREMQPALAETMAQAQENGVVVLAYNCQVSPDTIEVDHEVPFNLYQNFNDPN